MRGLFQLFKLLIPISVVVVAVLNSESPLGPDRPGGSPDRGFELAIQDLPDQQAQWRKYLQQSPQLARHQRALLQLSERLSFETFSSLSPELQERLAVFAENRLDPNILPATICWEPGVSIDVVSAFHAVEEMASESPTAISEATQYSEDGRWGRNATFNSFRESGEQGLPTTLTWSFIPDGTSIYGYNGEPTSNSDLVAFLDARYGVTGGGNDLTTRPWFEVFEDAFADCASLTGISYVYEPNDDGAALTQFSAPGGSLGTRGDIRIGGHFIDGQSGSNTLAYNFFPSIGEMIIDTSNSGFYGNLSSNSLNLQNVVAHENGHGLGLRHVCPVNQTKLMEPFVSRQFRGLQLDDIFSLNRLYGDFYEKQNSSRNNDSTGNASIIEVSPDSPFSRDFLSIDDNSDVDFYRIDNLPPGTFLSCSVTPAETPAGFVEGPQNENGSCSTGSPFDFSSVHDLSLDLFASNGSTVLVSSNTQPAGQSEKIISYEVEAGGTLFLRVGGGNANSTQLYTLKIAIDPTSYGAWVREEEIPEAFSLPEDDPDFDGTVNIQEYYFGRHPLIPEASGPITSSLSSDNTRYRFTFDRDPTAHPGTVFYQTSGDLVTWSLFDPAPDEISISPNGSLEKVTLELPVTGNGRYLRIGITPSE